MSIIKKALCIITALLLSAVSANESVTLFSVSYADKEDGSKIIVSLGDSYASGEGVEPFYGQDDPYKQYNLDWMAHRSEKSWSGQLTLPSVNGPMSKHKDENWFFVAASGATTEHIKGKQLKTATVYQLPIQYEVSQILPPQLSVFDNLGEGNTADYVTITIGGNDAHFSEIITLAATSSYYLNRNKLKQRIDQIWKEFYEEGGIRDKIKQAYHDIYDAAGPQATVIVAGYPTLLDRTGKGALFSIQEAEIINTAVEQFNVELEKIVIECQNEGLKICFVPIDFAGHEAYSKNSYLNPVWIGSRTQDLNAKIASHYSMHPNEKGIEQYRKAVQDKIDELEKIDPNSDTSYTEETDSVFELWHCIAKSEVLQYIGLPYSDINQIAGDLNNVDVEFDSWLRYLYRFSNMEWFEFSFETDLYQAEEETGYLGYIPANIAKRYVKENDRCDGVVINNLLSIGFEGSVTAEGINAQVFEFMPDSGLWIAQTLRDGCDFYFICEDSSGLISERCACWIVADLPSQNQTDIWEAIDCSGVLNYISMTYGEIKSKGGSLESFGRGGDEFVYRYSFKDLPFSFSFETGFHDAYEDGYDFFFDSYPIETVERYIKSTDRCDGVSCNLSMIGFNGTINAKDLGAEVGFFGNEENVWRASIERGNYTFLFRCDQTGTITGNSLCVIYGKLPEQTSVTSNTQFGWINVGRSEATWQEGDWYYYSSGQPVTGWQKIDGQTYYFHQDGKMAQSFTTIDSVTYYFQEHFEGAGPSTGDKPNHGALSHGGFQQRSIGDMVFVDSNGRVVTFDGEGSQEDGSNYFEYATQAFDLIWDYNQLSYYEDIVDYGYYDIDGDASKEFYIKRGTCEADYVYEFYTADMDARQYRLIGTVEGSHSYLEWSNNHLYLIGGQMDDEWKNEIRLVDGRIIVE